MELTHGLRNEESCYIRVLPNATHYIRTMSLPKIGDTSNTSDTQEKQEGLADFECVKVFSQVYTLHLVLCEAFEASHLRC